MMPDGSLRLTGGSGPDDGRVEIYFIGQWHFVDSDWDLFDAIVVCRQLGYPTVGARAYGGSLWGYSFAPIWLSSVQCRGTEERIVDCARSKWGDPGNCFFFRDVSVVCQISKFCHVDVPVE